MNQALISAAPSSALAFARTVCCACGFDEMQRVDDADAAAVVQIEDGLGVLEVRVHLRGGVDEPCAEMACGVIGVFFFAGQLPCGGERGNDEAEAHHGFSVVVEVGGVGEAVAADVGAVGIFFVGPPVVALGEVVVRAAFAAFAVRGGDGDGLLGEVAVRGGKDAGAVGGGDEVVGAWMLSRHQAGLQMR